MSLELERFRALFVEQLFERLCNVQAALDEAMVYIGKPATVNGSGLYGGNPPSRNDLLYVSSICSSAG